MWKVAAVLGGSPTCQPRHSCGTAAIGALLSRQPLPVAEDAKMPDAALPIVVIPDDIGGSFGSSPNIGRIRQVATVAIHGSRPSGETELGDRISGANVILSFRPAFTRFPRPVLDRP